MHIHAYCLYLADCSLVDCPYPDCDEPVLPPGECCMVCQGVYAIVMCDKHESFLQSGDGFS